MTGSAFILGYAAGIVSMLLPRFALWLMSLSSMPDPEDPQEHDTLIGDGWGDGR